MDDAKGRVMRKVRKCMAVAADPRGDPTTRETAARQALALMAKLNQDLDELPPPAAQAMPSVSSPDWAPYWAQRTVEDAMQAGVTSPVRTAQGWYIPG